MHSTLVHQSVCSEEAVSPKRSTSDYESEPPFLELKPSHDLSGQHRNSSSIQLLLSPPYPTLNYDLEEEFSGEDMRSDLSAHPYTRFSDLRGTMDNDYFCPATNFSHAFSQTQSTSDGSPQHDSYPKNFCRIDSLPLPLTSHSVLLTPESSIYNSYFAHLSRNADLTEQVNNLEACSPDSTNTSLSTTTTTLVSRTTQQPTEYTFASIPTATTTTTAGSNNNFSPSNSPGHGKKRNLSTDDEDDTESILSSGGTRISGSRSKMMRRKPTSAEELAAQRNQVTTYLLTLVSGGYPGLR